MVKQALQELTMVQGTFCCQHAVGVVGDASCCNWGSPCSMHQADVHDVAIRASKRARASDMAKPAELAKAFAGMSNKDREAAIRMIVGKANEDMMRKRRNSVAQVATTGFVPPVVHVAAAAQVSLVTPRDSDSHEDRSPDRRGRRSPSRSRGTAAHNANALPWMDSSMFTVPGVDRVLSTTSASKRTPKAGSNSQTRKLSPAHKVAKRKVLLKQVWLCGALSYPCVDVRVQC